MYVIESIGDSLLVISKSVLGQNSVDILYKSEGIKFRLKSLELTQLWASDGQLILDTSVGKIFVATGEISVTAESVLKQVFTEYSQYEPSDEDGVSFKLEAGL
ncbi:hypothetical protein [Photobacterium atrarenae]|uniref:Uncharacterized protein n=1 Tax=Photobacterium atrarenae TaxID=865757 RepID=A0ABY5GF45_9GAMM|nr:hypothetical protein [Photobacterium atrarenae]UTV27878.1 hypothetical protein NNL38_00700 [Photobacterium atrarenae]